MFVGLGASGVIPIVQGIQTWGYAAMDERMGLSFVILQGAIYIFGAFLYAVRSLAPLAPTSRTFVQCWGLSVSCSGINLTLSRHVGRKGHFLASSTSGAARTSFSTSVWSSQR